MRVDELQREFGDYAEAALNNVAIIAESYRNAALALDIDMDDVEKAVLNAAREWGGCVSCRHSRAPSNADKYARQRGALLVMMRTCILGLRQETCGARESIFPEL
jgi:hypothetical protein